MKIAVANIDNPHTTTGRSGVSVISAPAAPSPTASVSTARWPYTSIHRPDNGVATAPTR